MPNRAIYFGPESRRAGIKTALSPPPAFPGALNTWSEYTHRRRPWRNAAMTSPTEPATPYAQGVAYLKRGEYEAAVAAFTEAIRLDPAASAAYVGRGLAHRSLGDEAAALRDEEKARELGGAEPPPEADQLFLLTPAA